MFKKYFFRGKVALGHGRFDDKEIFLSWQGSVGTRRKSFFRGKVQKEGNYFFPVVVLIVTSLSRERNRSRLLGQCSTRDICGDHHTDHTLFQGQQFKFFSCIVTAPF